MASLSTGEKLELECPICFELPEAEVYQCKEGHPLCNKCYLKVKECPQCRVPLGKQKIRNRFMESILDKTELPCRYMEVGCSEVWKRQDRTDKREHEIWCLYRWRLFGICDVLGFKCDYKTNLLKPAEVLAHFEYEHGFSVESKSYANTVLENFDEIDGSKNITWSPFILKLGETPESPKLIFLIQVNKRDKALRMGCQLLEDPLKDITTNYTVTFSIKPPSSKVANISWSIRPRAFSSLAGRTARFVNYAIFKLPLDMLKMYYMSDKTLNLTVNVQVGSVLENMNGLCIGVQPLPLHLLPTEKFRDYWDYALWSCSECELNINEHLWYKCLQCGGYVLCGECMLSKKHSHHVFAMLKGEHQQIYIALLSLDNKENWTAVFPSKSKCLSEANQPNVEDSHDTFPIECDFCRSFPIIGVLYRCLLCLKNVDICQSCVDKGEHQCHILEVILNSKQEDFLNSMKELGSSLIPLLASKVNLS